MRGAVCGVSVRVWCTCVPVGMWLCAWLCSTVYYYTRMRHSARMRDHLTRNDSAKQPSKIDEWASNVSATPSPRLLGNHSFVVHECAVLQKCPIVCVFVHVCVFHRGTRRFMFVSARGTPVVRHNLFGVTKIYTRFVRSL